MQKRLISKTFVSPIILLIMIISLMMVGFSSWQIQWNPVAAVNVSIEVADLVENGNLSISNVNMINNNITFDSSYQDEEGRIISNLDKESNMKINISGVLNGYANDFAKIKTNIVIDDTNNKNGISYREIFYNLVNKEYIQMPSFEDLNKACIQREDSIIDDKSYWIDAISSNKRTFRINSSFKWGKFFNYSSPSVFFDSNNNNGYKVGNSYTNKEIKEILAEIDLLNGATYHIYLSLLAENTSPYKITFNPNGGTFNQVEGTSNVSISNIQLYDEVNIKTVYKEDFDFICWQNESSQYYANKIYYASDFVSTIKKEVTLMAYYTSLSSTGTISYKTDKDNYVKTASVKISVINKTGTSDVVVNSSTSLSQSLSNIKIGSLVKIVYSLYVASIEFNGFGESDSFGYRKVTSSNFSIIITRELAFAIPITFSAGNFQSIFTLTDFATKNVDTITRLSASETLRNYEVNKDSFIKFDRIRGITSIDVSGTSANSEGYYKASEITGIVINCTNAKTMSIVSSGKFSWFSSDIPDVSIVFYNNYGNYGQRYEYYTYTLTTKEAKTETVVCSADEFFDITKANKLYSITPSKGNGYSVNSYSKISVVYKT